MGRIGALLSLALLVAGSAEGATLTLTESQLSITIGDLPPLTIAQDPESVPITVSSAGGAFTLPAGIFAGTASVPSSLLTPIPSPLGFPNPIVDTLRLTLSGNGTLDVAPSAGPGGGFGGSGAVDGYAVVGVLNGLINTTIPLRRAAGVGGFTRNSPPGTTPLIFVTGHFWTTGSAVVTGITTSTPGGAVVNTATLAGFDARTAGHRGTVSLVTPVRVLSGALGNLPVFATQRLTFVPEPGTLVLLGAGAIVLMGLVRGRG